MCESVTTTDLSAFGWREKKMASELLNAMIEQSLPNEFWDEKVTVMFNTHSSYVFLTNSEFQMAMLNGDNLEMWYTCSECGHEGFLEDMEHSPEDEYCQEYLRQTRELV